MKRLIKPWHFMLLLLLLAGSINYHAFERIEMRTQIDSRAETRATPTINLLLGGFRGVVADWLWLRAMMLQEQGRFVEIIQLAEWITALQPQFPDIWALHAWNLAYNITVLLPDGDERWRWVQHGYEILRDQAIPATRFHPRTCTELAWLLMHKIGGTTDDFADTLFFRWYQKYAPYLAPDGTLPSDPVQVESFRRKAGFPACRFASFEDQYGPHDWRHPLTHAAAWAYVGFKQDGDQAGTIPAERFLLQAYRQLLFNGTIRQDEQVLVLEPDLHRAQAVLTLFSDAYQRGRLHEIDEMYLMTMERVIQLLAAKNQITEAEEIYAQLVEQFPASLSAERGLEALTALPFQPETRKIPILEESP